MHNVYCIECGKQMSEAYCRCPMSMIAAIGVDRTYVQKIGKPKTMEEQYREFVFAMSHPYPNPMPDMRGFPGKEPK